MRNDLRSSRAAAANYSFSTFAFTLILVNQKRKRWKKLFHSQNLQIFICSFSFLWFSILDSSKNYEFWFADVMKAILPHNVGFVERHVTSLLRTISSIKFFQVFHKTSYIFFFKTWNALVWMRMKFCLSLQQT